MSFDFSALKGEIIKTYGTRKKFAEAMGMTQSNLSNKLNGAVKWSHVEIYKAQELLSIPDDKIHAYFFKREVH